MKELFLGLLIFSSISVSALTGEQLIESGKQALGLSVFEIDQESIEAFQVENDEHESEVEILFHDEVSQSDDILAYGCHLHGVNVACHEEGHLHNKNLSFNDFYKSYLIATDTFKKVVLNLGTSIDSLNTIKGWKLAGHDHDHGNEEEAEFWFKFNYFKNGNLESVYSMCHHHGGGAEIDCHFTFDGEGEPLF